MPFLMKEDEQQFLSSHLTSETRVLEIGSGVSTLEFAKKVKSVVSLEHNYNWYKKTKNTISGLNNVEYILKRPNKRWKKYITDGNYDSFKDYIDYLISLESKKFDLVLVDGRARKDCMMAIGSHHPNAFFFLHDFYQDESGLKKNPSRREYLDLLEHFELLDLVGTLAKFQFRGIE